MANYRSPSPIVTFSHDWGGDPLSKNHLMRLAAQKHRVLWVNSIGYRTPTATARDVKRVVQKLGAVMRQRLRQVEPNIWVLSPIVIPAYGSRLLQRLNQRWLTRQVRGAMRKLGFEQPINWVFNPAAATVAGRLDERLLVYYCVDDYLEIEGVNRQAMAELEDALIGQADVLIASATTLRDKKTRGKRQPHLVRHGVQYDHFRTAVNPDGPLPTDVRDLPRPLLGYFGLMSTDWFDVDLVRDVARRYASGSVVLLGKSTMDLSSLLAEPNVHWLGQKPFASLPDYCRAFDVALLPFPVTELTRNANPLKVREYLAAGLPVVSTRIPEVEEIGGCFVAGDASEFADLVGEALADGVSRDERSQTMSGESWAARYADAERLITNALESNGDR